MEIIIDWSLAFFTPLLINMMKTDQEQRSHEWRIYICDISVSKLCFNSVKWKSQIWSQYIFCFLLCIRIWKEPQWCCSNVLNNIQRNGCHVISAICARWPRNEGSRLNMWEKSNKFHHELKTNLPKFAFKAQPFKKFEKKNCVQLKIFAF